MIHQRRRQQHAARLFDRLLHHHPVLWQIDHIIAVEDRLMQRLGQHRHIRHARQFMAVRECLFDQGDQPGRSAQKCLNVRRICIVYNPLISKKFVFSYVSVLVNDMFYSFISFRIYHEYFEHPLVQGAPEVWFEHPLVPGAPGVYPEFFLKRRLIRFIRKFVLFVLVFSYPGDIYLCDICF